MQYSVFRCRALCWENKTKQNKKLNVIETLKQNKNIIEILDL